MFSRPDHLCYMCKCCAQGRYNICSICEKKNISPPLPLFCHQNCFSDKCYFCKRQLDDQHIVYKCSLCCNCQDKYDEYHVDLCGVCKKLIY